MVSNQAYETVNKEWKRTCKIILGEELGELRDYEEWLLKGKEKMSVAEGNVVFATEDYPRNVRTASFDIVVMNKPFQKFSVNEIKDIDSIFGALEERDYCGSVVLGNSQNIELSTNVTDSYNVYRSARIDNSKNIACSTIVRNAENAFGNNVTSLINYSIRCHQSGVNSSRGLDSVNIRGCADFYYSYNCENCNDVMFSVNLYAARNCIGNLELTKEKYTALKKELLRQIAEKLRARQKVDTLPEILNRCELGKEQIARTKKIAAEKGNAKETEDMKAIEKCFSTTSRIVLGNELKGIDGYAPWLKQHVLPVLEGNSVLAAEKISVPGYANIQELNGKNFVSYGEFQGLIGKLRTTEKKLEGITFENIHEVMGDIAFVSPQVRAGQNANIIWCPIAISAVNCYNVLGAVYLKNSGYSVWSEGSDHLFACSFCIDSMFSIKSYQSKELKACFEVDSSRQSSSSYYCHNIENCNDSMFCFNAKNMNYAIGNTVVGPEKFKKVKSMLLEWINHELEKNKSVPLSIFNLGEWKRND